MSVGLFYNQLDWTNKSIIKHLRKKNIKVEAIDINDFVLDIHAKNKIKHNLYVNRVYPSNNLKSYNALRFMLEITRYIENIGIPVINSFDAAYIDYSKTEANNVLRKHKIPTASTLLFSNPQSAKKAINNLKFPLIIKMDCGGRAINVYKADTKNEYMKIISKLSKGRHLIHVEDFYKSKGYATRLFLLDYKFMSATKKSLIKGWLGSTSKGAKSTLYPEIPKKIITLGEKVAKISNAKILGLDIIETKNSPIVVDINCTPVFKHTCVRHYGYNPPEKIADLIAKEHSAGKK